MTHPSPLNATAIDEVLSSQRVHLLLIAFLAITVMFSKLGSGGIANYDDAHYAQKAKEVLRTGDWVTMHYNGLPTYEQPPVFIGLIAVSFKLFGVSEYTAKLPSALFGLATVVLLYFFGKHLFDQWTGLFSALVLATTQIFTRYASRAMQDVTLTFFGTLALFALVLAVRKDRRYFLLWGLSISLAILVKSVLGFFPAFISVLYLLLSKRWKTLFDPYFLAGSALVFTLGCSWYYYEVSQFGAKFLNVHFGWIILQRGFNAPPEPWHAHLSYAKDLLMYYWPWLPLFAYAVWRFGRKAVGGNDSALLVLVWALTVFVTMSLMQTRILWYIMQMFPAAAILCGATMDELLGEGRRVNAVKVWMGLAFVAAIAINATPLPLSKEREVDIRALAPYVKHFGERGACIASYKLEYYGVNNTMIFYTDQNIGTLLPTKEELVRRFARPDTVLCFIANEEIPQLSKDSVSFWTTRKAGAFALISNRQLDISDVRTW